MVDVRKPEKGSDNELKEYGQTGIDSLGKNTPTLGSIATLKGMTVEKPLFIYVKLRPRHH